MNFNQFNLDSRLNEGIKREGFREPTPIQEKAIPVALTGRDLIGTAQTGTGKTAAFVLPMLHKLIKSKGKSRGTKALIITPTRELADQIYQTVNKLKKGTNIRSVAVYGGVNARPQIDAMHRGVEVIVATPGRLLDHLQKRHGRFENLQMLIVDEADRMFDMGFLPDIKRILEHVPERRQTMLFSATFPKDVERFAAQILSNPERVTLGLSRPVHTVAHTLYPVSQNLKKGLLVKLLKQTDTKSVLIFTRTKHRAQRLATQLGHDGYNVTSLHGDRTQGQRNTAIKGFKQGKFKIMVATDVAARGLDIDRISHVINYDMPDTADAYIHRIGRTGRATRKGAAFTFTTPNDRAMVQKIERIMKEKLPMQKLPGFDYGKPTKEYPKAAYKSRKRNKRKVYGRSKQRAHQYS
jgi:superfamily II DNA/RNA helicase